MKDLIKFLNKNILFVSILIFSVVFIFSRIIFLFIPYVEITVDSIEYINHIDNFLAKGLLPSSDFIPLGYPVIVKLLSLLHNSVYTIVIFQNLVTYFACILLIITAEKKYSQKSIFVAIPLCIFILSPNNIYYDTTILTESLYVSSLLIIAALMIFALHSLKKIHWILLSVSLTIPLLLRPTGAFTLVIFLIILLYCIFKIKIKVITISFVLPYLIILLFLSTYSMIASNHFTFTHPERINDELNMNSPMDYGEKIKFGAVSNITEKPSLRKAIKHYYWIQCCASSFNQKLKNNYQKFHEFNWPTNVNYGPPDSIYKIDQNKLITDKEKQNAFKEFYNKTFIETLELGANKYRKSIIFKVYDWYDIKVHAILFANYAWAILLFLSFFWGLIQVVYSKFNNKDYLILVLLCLLNIGTNMIHIITTHRSLPRYEYPGEFLYYLVPFFLIICIKNVKK